MKRSFGLLIVSLALAFTSFYLQHQVARPVILTSVVANYETHLARFEVIDMPTQISGSQSYTVSIKLQEIELDTSVRKVNARGRLVGSREISETKIGSQFECRLELKPSALGQRFGYRASCKSPLKLIRPAPTGLGAADFFRSRFKSALNGVDADSAGLVAGLAIGDTQGISQELQQNMKTVSLTHLTAVSGANCAIVVGLFYWLFVRIGANRWQRTVLGIGVLISYVSLVGAQPSVIRAAVMVGMVLISIGLGRKANINSALAFACLVILIVDPWLAADFGFALSVAATLGILILTKPLADRLESFMPKYLALAISVAISAQLFCLPILLQLQNGLATYSLLANLIAEPLVAPITVLGIIACILSPVIPAVASILIYLASLPAWIIKISANQLASAPGAVIAWPIGLLGAVAGMGLITATLLWFFAKPVRLRNIAVLTLVIFSASTIGAATYSNLRTSGWPLKDWQVVACDVGQGDSIIVRSQQEIAVIDTGRDSKFVSKCLDNLNIKNVDLLVLTHFDMDHVGALSGILPRHRVKNVLVSPFADSRWTATGTDLLMRNAGVPIIKAERGMSGLLGNARWRVLAPEHSALGALDSNSASIVMLFELDGFNFLTMADSGEQSQAVLAHKSDLLQQPNLHLVPLVLKVSHHGSADQFSELIEHLKPTLSLISVGKENSYGHPTKRTIELLNRLGSLILRTDEQGSIAIASSTADKLVYGSSGHG